MKSMKQLLGPTPRVPLTVGPDDSVFSALELMAKNDIGAVLVMRDGQLAGIFSERDYARKIVLLGKTSRETPVGAIMTADVICVTPEQSADKCMAIMTDRRIRHLPVLDGGRLAGIISIGDVVKAIIADQRVMINHLEDYIHG